MKELFLRVLLAHSEKAQGLAKLKDNGFLFCIQHDLQSVRAMAPIFMIFPVFPLSRGLLMNIVFFRKFSRGKRGRMNFFVAS